MSLFSNTRSGWLMLAVLLLAVVAVLLTLPAGAGFHPVAWVVFAVAVAALVAVVLAYVAKG